MEQKKFIATSLYDYLNKIKIYENNSEYGNTIDEFTKTISKYWIPMWNSDYSDSNLNETELLIKINSLVAMHYLYALGKKFFDGIEEIEWSNEKKQPTNHFQMYMHLDSIILYSTPFIYVDDNHKIIVSKSKVSILDYDYNDIVENITLNTSKNYVDKMISKHLNNIK